MSGQPTPTLRETRPDVVTWNVHGINHSVGTLHSWDRRKAAVERVLKGFVSDGVKILLLQEVNSAAQLADIKKMLGSRWSYTRNAANDYIFYDNTAYERPPGGLHRDIDLKSTSGQGRRLAFTELRDKKTGVRFYVGSIHLSSGNPASRLVEAKAAMAALAPYARFFVGGDWNSYQGSDPLQYVRDAGRSVLEDDIKIVNGDHRTFHSFKNQPEDGNSLDHFIYGEGFVIPLSGEVITSAGMASDHLPVRAQFRITQMV